MLNVLNPHKIRVIIVIITIIIIIIIMKIIIIINIRKCKSLAIKIKGMWNAKTEEIPVAIGQLDPSLNHS